MPVVSTSVAAPTRTVPALAVPHVGSELFDSDAAIRLRAAGRIEHDRLTGTRTTSASDADDRQVLVNLVVRDFSGAAVGCAALVPAPEGVVELHRFFIAADARDTMAGHALLSAVDGYARRLEAPAVVYETSPLLTDSIRLLQQQGYQQIAPWRHGVASAPTVAYVHDLQETLS